MLNGARRTLPSRDRLRDISNLLIAAVAASLPWSTSATGILIAIWLVSLPFILRPVDVVRELRTPAGALPVALWALAFLGMFWADVSWTERLRGLEPFHKLLVFPLLFAQFRSKPNANRILCFFLAASLALVLLSWALALLPGLPWRGKQLGVPVKDYISQSGIFTLCIFGLLYVAIEDWRNPTRRWIALGLVAAFFGNVAYVATSRTSLVVLLALALLLALRRFGWKGIVALCILSTIASAALWWSSPYLRERITSISSEAQQFGSDPGIETSGGVRLEFWKKSLVFIRQALFIGHGTGTVPKLFTGSAAGEKGLSAVASNNPHNQTFMVAIQLGLIGAALLYAMWLAHLLLFCGDNLTSWAGMCVVVQNIVGSAFNSHLSDFSQGWVYVIGIGVLGGCSNAIRTSIEKTGAPQVIV